MATPMLMIPTADDLSVVSVHGSPLCWFCGVSVPQIGGRWCGPRCAFWGQELLDGSTPSPDEIARRAAAVRETWTDEERHKRALGLGRHPRLRHLGHLPWRLPRCEAPAE